MSTFAVKAVSRKGVFNTLCKKIPPTESVNGKVVALSHEQWLSRVNQALPEAVVVARPKVVSAMYDSPDAARACMHLGIKTGDYTKATIVAKTRYVDNTGKPRTKTEAYQA